MTTGAPPHVAIVGPGLMGLGIAQVAAGMGCRVSLVGRDASAAAAGRDRLGAALLRRTARGQLAADAADASLGRVTAVQDDADLATCDLAIEAVPEDRALKIAVLRRLDAALPDRAWIATNTSGLPVGGLATALRRPQRLIGLHFFSPVERMKLVEVVRATTTDAATLEAALGFVARLGQTAVVVRDGPGFFTSRVFAAYLDEALALVAEGVDPARIDAAAVGNGRAIGPLAVLDDISLALNLQQIRQARADGLPVERCRPLAAPVLEAMIAAGRRGRRDGGGFYDAKSTARSLWSGLERLFPRSLEQPSYATIARRLAHVEALEALRCLDEGVIEHVRDADTASLLGLGLAADTGGVLDRVEHRIGVACFVAECDALVDAHGARFVPPGRLREPGAVLQPLTGDSP